MEKPIIQILCSTAFAAIIVALINGIVDIIKKKMDKNNVSLKDVKDSIDQTREELKTHKKETKENIEVLKRSQMQQMRERIKNICRDKIHEGSISSDELEDLTALHSSYKELGGNGFCDKLMKKVNQLPIN